MLHTKFCENRPASPGKEEFEWFLPYMGVAAILVMKTRYLEQNIYATTQGGST